MSLNGWQRSWVVLTTLWLAVVLLSGYQLWPMPPAFEVVQLTPQQIQRAKEVAAPVMPADFYAALAKLSGGKSMADRVAETLLAVPTADDVRVEALRAFYSSTTEDELTTKLLAVPVPESVKAALWDFKHAEATGSVNYIDSPLEVTASESRPFSERYALATSRTIFAVQLIALGAIPAAILYALGWSVGWVRRGFKATLPSGN